MKYFALIIEITFFFSHIIASFAGAQRLYRKIQPPKSAKKIPFKKSKVKSSAAEKAMLLWYITQKNKLLTEKNICNEKLSVFVMNKHIIVQINFSDYMKEIKDWRKVLKKLKKCKQTPKIKL